MDIKVGILLLLVSGSVIEAVPTLTPQPTAPDTGSTLTLTCELLAGFTTALMSFDKDGATLYTCGIGGQTCDDSNGVSDYSEVDWSQTNKGIITIYNADQSRDGGDWTCTVGSGGGTSLPVTLAITAIPTTTATTTTTSTTVSPSTTTTIPGTTVTSTTTGTTNHTGGPTTNTISSTTALTSSPPVAVIIAISAGVGLVIVIGITIAIVRKSKIKETVGDRHSSGIDNHGIDLKEHSNRDHHL